MCTNIGRFFVPFSSQTFTAPHIPSKAVITRKQFIDKCLLSSTKIKRLRSKTHGKVTYLSVVPYMYAKSIYPIICHLKNMPHCASVCAKF